MQHELVERSRAANPGVIVDEARVGTVIEVSRNGYTASIGSYTLHFQDATAEVGDRVIVSRGGDESVVFHEDKNRLEEYKDGDSVIVSIVLRDGNVEKLDIIPPVAAA